MIFCYHPACYNIKGKNPICLRDINSIHDYITLHLVHHDDELGIAMQQRFTAIYKNRLIDINALNEISISPYELLKPVSFMDDTSIDILNRYGIKRDFNPGMMIYSSYWKSRMIFDGVLDSSSLPFQEDDALVSLYLHYPNPITDWSMYKTIAFYFMKCYCSLSGAAVNLFRGITDYPRLSGNQSMNLTDFISNVNHPGPAVTTIQRWMPTLSYVFR